jgi:chaperone required for assembly of F1-ATPase
MSDDRSRDVHPTPMQAAQRAMRPTLPKRFYQSVSIGEEGGFTLLLDGKQAKTPAKRPLIFPVRALAEKVAQEWDAQAGEIDPTKMPMTRLANLAIDQVAEKTAGIQEEILRYAASDLVLYRAGEPEGLVATQSEHWDPIVRWARDTLRANFILAEGVNFVIQPETALAAVQVEIQDYPPPFSLAALASITQLSGSALIALMLGRGRISAVQAWNAAYVDEDWNMRQWGEDAEAVARRTARLSEFEAAAKMLTLIER